MNKKELSNYLSYLDQEIMLMDGFEEAFIGLSKRCGQPTLATYSFIKMMQILVDRDDMTFEEAMDTLKELKQEHAKKTVSKKSPFELPNRLWESLVFASEIDSERKWADLSKKQLTDLANQLTNGEFQVNGKSTFKEEFVTAGGIDLKEINFKTMESKLHKNLFFAGEIVNVDAITGGFNFQNAWTSGFIVANAMVE